MYWTQSPNIKGTSERKRTPTLARTKPTVVVPPVMFPPAAVPVSAPPPVVESPPPVTGFSSFPISASVSRKSCPSSKTTSKNLCVLGEIPLNPHSKMAFTISEAKSHSISSPATPPETEILSPRVPVSIEDEPYL
ncbi:hypothetical protein LXL04_003394 [Taraxacum kok-saghyz]